MAWLMVFYTWEQIGTDTSRHLVECEITLLLGDMNILTTALNTSNAEATKFVQGRLDFWKTS